MNAVKMLKADHDRVQELIDIVDKILIETAAQCVRRKRSDGSEFPVRPE